MDPTLMFKKLVLLSFQTIGSLLLRRRTHSPCHRQPPFYDLGCGSGSNWRRCPCFVVGFRLPLDLCFVLLLVSWWGCFGGIVIQWLWWWCAVVMQWWWRLFNCGGGGGAWWWWSMVGWWCVVVVGVFEGENSRGDFEKHPLFQQF